MKLLEDAKIESKTLRKEAVKLFWNAGEITHMELIHS
jgi:hypothetical protein